MRQLIRWRKLTFLREEKGAVLLEAAIAFPILVLIFVAMVEISVGYTARRKAASVAPTVADLVAQQQSVTTDQLNDIVAAARPLLAPYPASAMQLTISSVGIDASGNSIQYWTCNYPDPAQTPTCGANGTEPPVPAGIIAPGMSVIVVRSTYTYVPVSAAFLTGNLEFQNVAYFKPRMVTLITRV
jgi:Flp pilus assembly protein TadG